MYIASVNRTLVATSYFCFSNFKWDGIVIYWFQQKNPQQFFIYLKFEKNSVRRTYRNYNRQTVEPNFAHNQGNPITKLVGAKLRSDEHCISTRTSSSIPRKHALFQFSSSIESKFSRPIILYYQRFLRHPRKNLLRHFISPPRAKLLYKRNFCSHGSLRCI